MDQNFDITDSIDNTASQNNNCLFLFLPLSQ